MCVGEGVSLVFVCFVLVLWFWFVYRFFVFLYRKRNGIGCMGKQGGVGGWKIIDWNILLENIIFHKNYFKREVGGSMCVHQEGHESKVSWEEQA